MPLKILTWNINGIRAINGKTVKQLLDSLQADVICLQETKVTRDMLDEPTAIVDGYDSYFSFSRKRTGYSGTANYCNARTTPLEAEEGLSGRLSTSSEGFIKCYGNTDQYVLDLDALDAEGRCVITLHQIRLTEGLRYVAIINVYVPRAGDKEERIEYKLKFLSLLQSRAEAFLEHKIHVIILGDLNLTHKKIDNCDPECDDDFKLKASRIWMNKMLRKSEQDSSLPNKEFHFSSLTLSNVQGGMFSDSYRHLHPDKENAFTNWNTSTDARKTNYGRRLDYILVDTELLQYVSNCEIMSDVEGSDHCPVVVTLNCDSVPSKTSPQLSSKYMPEFRGQQQKLSSFFSKSVQRDHSQCSNSSSSPLLTPSIDDLQEISCSPVDNLSGSQPILKRNSTESLESHSTLYTKKRKAALSIKKKIVKKMKKQDDVDTKQVSLTSFLVKTNSASKLLTDTTSLEDTGSSQNKSAKAIENFPTINKFTISSLSTDLMNSKQLSVHPATSNVPSVTNTSKSEITAVESKSSTNTITTNSAPLSAEPSSIINIIKNTSSAWKSILTGPRPAPMCSGHKEPCILKTVNKKGPNKNKQFYVCARPEGAADNPNHRCNYFMWYNNK